jgi:hypothetical protein
VCWFGALLVYVKVEECGFWLAQNAVRVHGQLGAGQSDATRRRRGRSGLVSLIACTEGSQACLLAWLQGLGRSTLLRSSYHGHRRTWDRERAGSSVAQASEVWGRAAELEGGAALVGGRFGKRGVREVEVRSLQDTPIRCYTHNFQPT